MFTFRPSLLLVTIIGLSACAKSDVSPVPVIQTFSPLSGPVASSVKITGMNFSATPEANEVKFNGAKATVTASSSTSLTVTVPASATTGIITVTVNGHSALSTTAFTINPLIGTWLSTGVTANNCVVSGNNGVFPCTTNCPTLTFSLGGIVYTNQGQSVNFTYTLTGNRLDISNGLSTFSPTYVISGSQLTLVYPPDECSLTETYNKQ